MTESELTALAALASAATPGPWRLVSEEGYLREGDTTNRVMAANDTICDNEPYSPEAVSPNNQAYIAAMHPQTTLGLIAEIKRLREAVKRQRTATSDVLMEASRAYSDTRAKGHQFALEAAIRSALHFAR